VENDANSYPIDNLFSRSFIGDYCMQSTQGTKPIFQKTNTVLHFNPSLCQVRVKQFLILKHAVIK